jgi:GT2 family glycosyltransferase
LAGKLLDKKKGLRQHNIGRLRGEVSNMHPKVSVVILNWNGLSDTMECLDSLKKITYSNCSVVVVDNGSKGNDVEALKTRFGNYISIIENDRNYGFAEGNNIGIRYALDNVKVDYILLLNNDMVVAPDFLSELVEATEKDISIGIAGPKIYYYGEPNKLQSAGARINWWSGITSLIGCGEIDKGQFDHLNDVDWVVGGGLLIKRQVLERIGLLYRPYFAYFEEAEWCTRCKKAGYRVVYVPSAKLWHKGAATTARIGGMRLYYMTRNRFLFMKRNATGLQFVCFFVRFFLRDVAFTTISMLLLQGDMKSLGKFYKGTYDGISQSLGRG